MLPSILLPRGAQATRIHRLANLFSSTGLALLLFGVPTAAQAQESHPDLPPRSNFVGAFRGGDPESANRGFRLRLHLENKGTAPPEDQPGYGSKNGTLHLKRFERGFRGTWRRGEKAPEIPVALVSSKGVDFLDTLLVDSNGDQKVQDGEKFVRTASAQGWDAELKLAFPGVRHPVTLPFYFIAYPEESDETLTIRYNHRAFMLGKGRVRGLGEVRVCIVDINIDGRFRIEDDHWALARVGQPERPFPPENLRAMTRHNWIDEVAFVAQSLNPDATELIIVPTKTELTREDERIRDDPYHADKIEKHSGESVTFLNDFEGALERARHEKRRLLVDFETSWCGPCKKMDELVYTADKVLEACAELVCVKVDGDLRKDLRERFEIEAYPTLLVLDAEGKVLGRHRGYSSVANLVSWLGTLP